MHLDVSRVVEIPFSSPSHATTSASRGNLTMVLLRTRSNDPKSAILSASEGRPTPQNNLFFRKAFRMRLVKCIGSFTKYGEEENRLLLNCLDPSLLGSQEFTTYLAPLEPSHITAVNLIWIFRLFARW